MPCQAGPRESCRAGQEEERSEAKAHVIAIVEAGKAGQGGGQLRMGWFG